MPTITKLSANSVVFGDEPPFQILDIFSIAHPPQLLLAKIAAPPMKFSYPPTTTDLQQVVETT